MESQREFQYLRNLQAKIIVHQSAILVLKVADAADAIWDIPETIIVEGRLILGEIEGWLLESWEALLLCARIHLGVVAEGGREGHDVDYDEHVVWECAEGSHSGLVSFVPSIVDSDRLAKDVEALKVRNYFAHYLSKFFN